jgi:hypothetical protein
MLITIICACIVGGMWWSTQRRIKKLQFEKINEQTFVYYKNEINKRLELLAKDIMELQKKGKKAKK